MTNDWKAAVERLLAMTQAHELRWKTSDLQREDAIGAVYEAEVHGRRVAVWEFSYRHYTDEDNWIPSQDVAIEFVDELGRCQWRWPETSGQGRLLDAVQYQVSNANEFLKQLLNS